MASAARVTEKPNAQQQQQQQQQKQQVLKCPRCNSSNTKFCYYNNYNLSQPRHFCKGCKRYWTRGGTLRNVPVGGGCRKNKRVKRPLVTSTTTTSSTLVHNPNPNSNPNLEAFPSSTLSKRNTNHHLNPLFHGLSSPQNPKYPRFVSRVSNETDVSRFGLLHPQMGSLGLGFSSSYSRVPFLGNQTHNSSSLFSNSPSIFSVGSTSSTTSDPTMASLLASNLHQEPRFLGFAPYEDDHGSVLKDGQLEGTQNRMDWNHTDQIKMVEPSDPNSFLWATPVRDGGEWLDPTNNIGFSVPSLI